MSIWLRILSGSNGSGLGVLNSTYLSINRTKTNRDSFSSEVQIIKHWAGQKTPNLKTVMHLSYTVCPFLLTIFPPVDYCWISRVLPHAPTLTSSSIWSNGQPSTNRSISQVIQHCFPEQNHKIVWVGRDWWGSLSPLMWMVCTGIKSVTLALLAPCSNQMS